MAIRVKRVLNPQTRTVTVQVGDEPEIIACLDDLSASVVRALALRGLQQLLGDAAAPLAYGKGDAKGAADAVRARLRELVAGLRP